MKCAYHGNAASVAACAGCGKPLCGECAVDLGGGAWCRDCLSDLVKSREVHPAAPVHGAFSRKLLAMLLSIVPGVGHMFLGQLGKGFAMMGLLFASIFLVILYSDSTGMYWLTAYLIPTLCALFLSYAVFDSREIASGRSTDRDPTMKAIQDRFLMNGRTFGFVLLIAGIVGILNIFAAPLNLLLRGALGVDMPATAIVVPVILTAGGIYLLWKGRKLR
jgi:hypothetical protein